jgi:hypothetical protein
MIRTLGAVALLLTVTAFAPVLGEARADERYQGYYYPEITVQESYEPRAPKLAEASRELRVAFLTGISASQAEKAYPAQVVAFSKGVQDDDMIFTALYDGPLATVYRTRAFFAQLTSVARLLPVFQEQPAFEDDYTFFDLAYMMGFVSITATDGRGFTYQVILDPKAAESQQ